MSGPLEGRGALITGASQGFGLAIARAYVEAGADVMLCARDSGRLDAARAEVAALAGSGQVVVARAADVSRPDHSTLLVDAAVAALPNLQILVNNAGVYGPIGRIEDVEWDLWVQAIATNLFGSILMCRALLPHFKRRGYGKIIQLSGGGATSPLPMMSAYAASKAAIVRCLETLAGEASGDGIDVNSIAPGAMNTRLLDQVLDAGPERAGAAFHARSVRQKQDGGAPMANGAALAVFLGSAASDGITGKLLSAMWDPWQRLDDHRDALQTTDVYTLRRIVPADRDLTWEDD